MPVFDGDLPAVDEPFVSPSDVIEEEKKKGKKLVLIDVEIDIQEFLSEKE